MGELRGWVEQRRAEGEGKQSWVVTTKYMLPRCRGRHDTEDEGASTLISLSPCNAIDNRQK